MNSFQIGSTPQAVYIEKLFLKILIIDLKKL